ncbi:HNH endonuclease signature motif containing protein [Pseudonocardia sp. N23]|uniref:HNH endonuclease n=1 Tax=Pseudonocardia sp. N23 TaxID=1987376 RepID=UPI001C0EBE17
MPAATLDAPSRTCPECHSPVTGRSDKRYCSRRCTGRATSRAQRQRGYHQAYRVTVPCGWCGRALQRDPRNLKAGHQPHCDNLCAAATRHAPDKAERHTRTVQNILASTTPRVLCAGPPPSRTCPGCHEPFTPHHIEQRWCRKQCAKRARRSRSVPRFVTSRCDCGTWFTIDRRAGYSGVITTCSRSCQRRTAARRRRARERNAYDEDVIAIVVFERDSWLCHLCGTPCDGRPSQTWRPLAATLDHVVPLARGGRHSYANVRTAHARCNSLKADQLVEAVAAMVSGPTGPLPPPGREPLREA